MALKRNRNSDDQGFKKLKKSNRIKKNARRNARRNKFKERGINA